MIDTNFPLIGDWAECDYNVVGVVMRDELNRMLCQLRDDFEHVAGGGNWTVFGGHHAPPETLLDCAIREMEEELGLKGKPEEFEPLMRFVPKDGLQAYHYYYLYNRPLTTQELRLGEGAGFAFFHHRQFMANPFMSSARIALNELHRRGEFAT